MYGAPYTEESSANPNPLRDDLREQRQRHEPAEAEDFNPLKNDLADERIKVEPTKAPPSYEPEHTEKPNREAETTTTTKEEKPGGAGKPKPEFSEEYDWAEEAEKLLKFWDVASSRFLKWLSKDSTRKNWELDDDEVEQIMKWLPKVTQHYKITVKNPLWWLGGTMAFIYGEKCSYAWRLRQQRSEPGYREPGAQPHEMTDEELERIYREIQRRRGKTMPDDDEPEEQPGRSFNRRSNKQRTAAEPENSYSFSLKDQIDRQFHQNNTDEPEFQRPNSTGGEKTNGGSNTHSTGKIYRPIPDSPGFAMGETGVEKFVPIKEEKDGRATEIVRCRLTLQLFERFAGTDKQFINHQAKQRYHYLKRLEEEGREPKDGWPPGWKFG